MLNPIGMATPTAITVVNNVPANKEPIPKCLSLNIGVHFLSVIKSTNDTSWKNSKVSKRSTNIIPTVIKIEIDAHKNNNFSMIISLTFMLKLI